MHARSLVLRCMMLDFRGRELKVGKPIVYASNHSLHEGTVLSIDNDELWIITIAGLRRRLLNPKNALMLLAVDYADLKKAPGMEKE